MTGRDGPVTVSRRDVLRWGALSGAALVLGFRGDRPVAILPRGEAPDDFAPNQWLAIDAAGAVTIVAAHSEMGQGVRTSLPMIVADELGADWARVTVVHAHPGPDFPDMRTSGSGTVIGSWMPLRRAAAAAREMLVAAAAVTWNVEPLECTTEGGAVVHRPSGRRAAFGSLVERAAREPVPENPRLRPPDEFRIIGTRVPRVDAPAVVQGTATFGLDVRVPGMRFAAVARSPRFGGRPGRFSAGQARAVAGVTDVIALPTGVAVVAGNTWAALRGRDALDVEWDDADAAAGSSEEYVAALTEALDRGKLARRDGTGLDATFANAARRMERTYVSPFYAHAAMEPLNCVAHVRDDRCELWVGTQAPNQVQEAVAARLRLPLERVVVNVTLLGGGFGRRLDTDFVLEAVEVSRAIGAPVQVVWSREDDVRHDMYQPAQVNRLTAAFDGAANVTACRHRVAGYSLTMFGPFDPDYDPSTDGSPWGGYDSPYAFPSFECTLAELLSPVPTGAWRSVGYPAVVFARESFLDELAHETGRDPLDLRLALLPSPGTQRIGGRDLPNGDRLRRVLTVAAERAGWRESFVRDRDGRRWGRGIACNSYHGRTMVAQVAEVSVGEQGDIRVHRVTAAVDCGTVINPWGVEAQFEGGVCWALSAALRSQITFRNGRTVQGNFNDFPVLRLREAPVVDVITVPSELPPTGIGEPPVPPVAPAVANAVFAATGQRLRSLPVRLAH